MPETPRSGTLLLTLGMVKTWGPSRRPYAWLASLICTTRLAMAGWGVPFNFELRWMFLADSTDLTDRLAQTVWNFHAFPPGMNVLTGLLLKFSPDHAATWAHLLFIAFGFLLTFSTYSVATALALSPRVSFFIAAVLSVSPPALYFENLYLYEYPAAALAMATLAAALHAASSKASWPWFAAFGTAAVLVWLRSAFHLVWFAAFVAWAIARAPLDKRRIALAAALPAAVLASSLYVKNAMLFGVFASTSWGGANLTAITTATLSPDERQAAIDEGHLSPLANISAFAGPEDYLPHVDPRGAQAWPKLSAKNFNHWAFLEANPRRAKDVRYFLETWPERYVANVFTKSLPQFFSATTRWHPRDAHERGPHTEIRRLLGPWEATWNAFFHAVPVAPVGLYLLLPLFVLGAGVHLVKKPRAWASLEGFLFVQCAYVIAVSVAVTYGECARYRFLIEPLIWLVAAKVIQDLARAAYGRR